MNNIISFGAQFVQKLPIKKYSYENKIYTKDYANLVELNAGDSKDLQAIENIAIDFGGDSYANNIYNSSKSSRNNNKSRLFALTKQTDNFENLNAYDVYGIAKISKIKNAEIELEYLQVHPRYIYTKRPFVKGVGSSILDYLKLVNNKICLYYTPSAYMFYKKNGFKKLSPDGNIMLWEKRPKDC